MQQVKIFKGLEGDIAALEGQVNAWIRQSGAKVIAITGNIAPQSQAVGPGAGTLGQSGFSSSDVVLIVLYETPE